MSPQTEKVACKLCGRQFAKYNCPTCNVAYCSLTCFRSPNHTRCSETFYKKEVEQEIQTEPSKSLEERMKMMELLKKFEESRDDGNDGLSSDDESEEGEEEDDLDQRFQNIDLNSASTAEVWSKLTSLERERFLKVMEDPAGGLAKQLLASEELENARIEPWWEAPTVEPNDEPGSLELTKRYGGKPDVMLIPSSMIKPIPTGPPLYYNVCIVCIAYAFTTRHLLVSPLSSLKSEDIDFEEARHLILQLAPFLSDRSSKLLYPNFSSMTTDVWSRFKPDQITPELFSMLLQDTGRLVRPLPVMTYQPETSQSQGTVKPISHPHVNLIRVLSDLAEMFKISVTSNGGIIKPNHTTHKLLFYAAHILSTPSSILRMVADQLEESSAMYRKNGIDDVSITQVTCGNNSRDLESAGVPHQSWYLPRITSDIK